MLSAITAALTIVKQLLSLLGIWKAEVHDVQQKNAGKNEVLAEEAKRIEEARREREKLDREISLRTDERLRNDLDKWMRD